MRPDKNQSTPSNRSRAEINRENARKSTGPATTEGKLASRLNALKHGLRAKVVSLPTEDPETANARTEFWNEYYQPQSPAAQHLVNECVSATLLSDRVHACQAAAMSKNARDVQLRHDDKERVIVNRFVDILKSDPLSAIRGLSIRLEGCRELMRRWEKLKGALYERGWLSLDERDEVIHLMGVSCVASPLSPEAWKVIYHNCIAQDSLTPADLKILFGPDMMPETLRDDFHPDCLHERETSLATLKEIIGENLYDLRNAEN